MKIAKEHREKEWYLALLSVSSESEIVGCRNFGIQVLVGCSIGRVHQKFWDR